MKSRAFVHWSSVTLAVVMLQAAAACGRASGSNKTTSNGAGRKLTIAVIPKGTTHEFWKAIHAGAVRAERELAATGDSVTLIWKGPIREDDREQQVQVVEGFVTEGVQGMVLAPLDSRGLVRPVEEARRAGVPTVIIDSGLETDSIVSFVATDNRKGGALAADRLGELLGGKGKALLLRYAEGSASTEEREKGFLEELHAKYPQIQLVSADQYAGPTRETAKRASENLLNRFGGDIQGIFTVNESSTIGMLLALQDINKAGGGQIHFIGFDPSPILITAMRAHQIDGLVVQDPMKMGYLGVKTMVDHLHGKSVPRRIDTGVTLVTPANLDSARVKELVTPPVAQYLAGR